jgi:predicted ATPase
MLQDHIFVTSRTALRLRGEHEFPVPPLELPLTTREAHPEDTQHWPATALFWERAQAVRPDLDLSSKTASLVAEICRKLDGLPLAIELAAARVKHLPLTAIRDQLEHRLELLVGGPLDLPLRQRAIRDTVGWSHDLLGPREQTLLRRLSVFAGGWSLDAIETVAGNVDEVGGALDGISALVDKSLVVLERNRADPRYDMLDVVREYAAARLSDAGETEEIERRHALHYLALSEAAEPHLVRSGHQDWFQRLDVDRGNLRRGMAWTIDHGERVLALRYSVALWRYGGSSESSLRAGAGRTRRWPSPGAPRRHCGRRRYGRRRRWPSLKQITCAWQSWPPKRSSSLTRARTRWTSATP